MFVPGSTATPLYAARSTWVGELAGGATHRGVPRLDSRAAYGTINVAPRRGPPALVWCA